MIVNSKMSMPDELPCFPSGDSKPKMKNHIIKSPLKKLQQTLPGNTAPCFRHPKIRTELFIKNTIHLAQFLLLTQLSSIIRDSWRSSSLLTRRGVSFFKSALGYTPIPFKKKFFFLTATKPTDRTQITSHF